jgi:hypothetical protein
MTKSIPTFAAALLMTAIATPVFAQAAIQEPGEVVRAVARSRGRACRR